jgi:hypothetical protein
VKKAQRKRTRNESFLIAPFESFAEIPPFHVPPRSVADTIEDICNNIGASPLNIDASPLSRFIAKEIEQEAHEERKNQERIKNVLYRLAFPEDKLSYWEALALAVRLHNSPLFNLIRLFSREIEKTEWFTIRERFAEQLDGRLFSQCYQEARENPVLWSPRMSKQLARLLPLAFYEPELRGLPPAEIFERLQTYHEAGVISSQSVPPNSQALRVYLHDHLGWKMGEVHLQTEEYYKELGKIRAFAELRKRLAKDRPAKKPQQKR